MCIRDSSSPLPVIDDAACTDSMGVPCPGHKYRPITWPRFVIGEFVDITLLLVSETLYKSYEGCNQNTGYNIFNCT